MYYNTTNIKDPELNQIKEKAMSQTMRIKEHFLLNLFTDFSASDIYNAFGCKWPITSVRRSLNTLMKDDIIEPVGTKDGLYGRPETVYASTLKIMKINL